MDRENRIKVDISSGTVFRIVFIILGFALLYYIADIVMMLLAAVVLAAAIEPVANYLQKYRIPRAVSVLVVYVAILAVVSGAVTLMIEPLAEQTQQLAVAIPRLANSVEEWLPNILHYDQETIAANLQGAVAKLGSELGNLSANIFVQTRMVLSGITAAIFVFVIAFYLVIEQDAMKKFVRLVTPKAHVAFVEQSVDQAQKKVGRWIVAQITLGVIVGIVVGLGLWVLRMPYALPLAVLAGILELLPVIGPVIAAVPGVIVGFAQSWLIGLLALALYIIVQQLENNVLVPGIMRRAIGLHPLVTIIAILFGARLAGFMGVILAVPIATIMGIFLSDVFGEGREQSV